MIDPYRMVVVNVICCILVFLGIAMYKFLYPKKSINLFFLLIVVSIIPVISIFRVGTYESGDFNIHIYRSMEFYNSLKEGNIYPSWAGNLNATYGLPLFLFNYSLPYYIISLFHYLGFSFIASMKLFLATSYVCSGIFMYALGRQLFRNNFAAFSSSVLYLFSPYYLIDLHFKVVIGEISAFTIIPLFFFFLIKLQEKNKLEYFLLSSLAFAALIMSHLVIALFISIIAVCYFIFTNQQNKRLTIPFLPILSISLGGLLTAYMWLTPFFMKQYTILVNTKMNFIPLENFSFLFFTPWRFGMLYQGHQGEIAQSIGYANELIAITTIALLILKKGSSQSRGLMKFWIVVFLLIFFMLTPLSKFIWETVPFIKVTGQHRLLLLSSFSLAISGGIIVYAKIFSKKIISVFISLAIVLPILNWGQRTVLPEITDNTLASQLPMSTFNVDQHFYANSKWVDPQKPWFDTIPSNRINMQKEYGEYKETSRTSIIHSYEISIKSDMVITENTLYFPGWKAKVDHQSRTIFPSESGTIQLFLKKGERLLEIYYEDIAPLKFLKQISFSGFILIIMILLFKKPYTHFMNSNKC